MNKIKVILASLVLFVMGVGFAEAQPGTTIAGGLNHTTVSTNAVIFSGAGTLFELQISTGAIDAFVIPFDTAAYSSGVNLGMFTSTQAVSPQIVFQSTTTASADNAFGNLGKVKFAEPYGVRIQNGLFLFFSGAGNRVTAIWKK